MIHTAFWSMDKDGTIFYGAKRLYSPEQLAGSPWDPGCIFQRLLTSHLFPVHGL
jgi:hypothetical protein